MGGGSVVSPVLAADTFTLHVWPIGSAITVFFHALMLNQDYLCIKQFFPPEKKNITCKHKYHTGCQWACNVSHFNTTVLKLKCLNY